MYITDINNQPIKVTDLDAALTQAKTFTEYFHEDKAFADMDKRQKDYWLDILDKLTQLKDQQSLKS
ncbi:MAG: hypothetical protein V4450_17350 [Bacteroidota bacterium]